MSGRQAKGAIGPNDRQGLASTPSQRIVSGVANKLPWRKRQWRILTF